MMPCLWGMSFRPRLRWIVLAPDRKVFSVGEHETGWVYFVFLGSFASNQHLYLIFPGCTKLFEFVCRCAVQNNLLKVALRLSVRSLSPKLCLKLQVSPLEHWPFEVHRVQSHVPHVALHFPLFWTSLTQLVLLFRPIDHEMRNVSLVSAAPSTKPPFSSIWCSLSVLPRLIHFVELPEIRVFQALIVKCLCHRHELFFPSWIEWMSLLFLSWSDRWSPMRFVCHEPDFAELFLLLWERLRKSQWILFINPQATLESSVSKSPYVALVMDWDSDKYSTVFAFSNFVCTKHRWDRFGWTSSVFTTEMSFPDSEVVEWNQVMSATPSSRLLSFSAFLPYRFENERRIKKKLFWERSGCVTHNTWQFGSRSGKNLSTRILQMVALRVTWKLLPRCLPEESLHSFMVRSALERSISVGRLHFLSMRSLAIHCAFANSA